jgi:Fic family protein
MNYITLKKAFHNPEVDFDALYHERFTALETIHLSLSISGHQAFLNMNEEVYMRMLQISKADKKILALSRTLPNRALQQFTERTLIDEIVLTNDIEGVNSSKKEIGDVLKNLEKQNKRQRFYGLVRKYALLEGGIDIPVSSPDDIRLLYDELVLNEVRTNQKNNVPDGKIFRKNPVSIYNAAGLEIHQGVFPEEKIIEYIEASLDFLNNSNVVLPVKTAIFHYLLGYIHPFYDGNGRLNRFISSYLLLQEYEPLVGFRISYAITQSIEKYYKGFAVCNDPLNMGDLTPFVLMFLDVIKKAVNDIVTVLSEKSRLLKENFERISQVSQISENKDLYELASVLIQVRMFSGDGITIKDLMELFGISRPTVMHRLEGIKATGLLEQEKVGREVHYQLNLEALAKSIGKTLR